MAAVGTQKWTYQEKINELQTELERKKEDLCHDKLTRLYNRDYFENKGKTSKTKLCKSQP